MCSQCGFAFRGWNDRKVVIGKAGAMIKLLEKLFECKSSLDDQGNMVIFGSNANVVDKTVEAVRGVILYVWTVSHTQNTQSCAPIS